MPMAELYPESQCVGVDLSEKQIASGLKMLEGDGVIRLDGNVLSVNDDTCFLVRIVASVFDAYLGQSGRTHSRAV